MDYLKYIYSGSSQKENRPTWEEFRKQIFFYLSLNT